MFELGVIFPNQAGSDFAPAFFVKPCRIPLLVPIGVH
jgi:hypothetical protein